MDHKRQEIANILAKNKFDKDVPPPIRKPLLTIRNEDGKEVILIEVGGRLLVTGMTGVRKSTLVKLITTAFFGKELSGKFKSYINGTILWIDTEQRGNEFFDFQVQLLDMCGFEENTPQINSYCFAALHTVEDRKLAIEVLMEQYKNVSIIVVDGIKDFLTDSNDEKQTNEVLNLFNKYLHERSMGMIELIHTDKQNRWAVGRAGTILTEKASYVMKLDLDVGTGETIVSPGKTRRQRFDKFKISHDENDKPFIVRNSWDSEEIFLEFDEEEEGAVFKDQIPKRKYEAPKVSDLPF